VAPRLPWNRHPEADHTPWIRAHVVRRVFLFLIGVVGIPLGGNRILISEDPESGKKRQSLITPWDFEGGRYFVSGSGESRWVRALRTTGRAQLKLGGHVEDIAVRELDDEEKLPVLRWYASFRIQADTDEDLRRLAPDYPVFEISTA
jgi:hypothetical protein